MRTLIGLAFTLLLTTMAFAVGEKETPKTDQKKELVCAKNDEIEKIMKEKGYSLLLNMTSNDGVIETLWIGGQSAVVTGTTNKSDTSCLLSTMNGIIFNPYTVEGIWESYKKQSKQKDI
mgnify:CR=1 FL=1